MRIQHNIAAMSAYRAYNFQRGSLGKNLEKLSSGYKINRAGDDAAGLAISEKMRAQITGLSAAQKNVKDGVSLVKTAEGALQEVQDMLGRMDYLATQSANGTYQNEVDRENLQKEVVSIKREIDRIANSANFNGIKLLDGSLNGHGEDIIIPGDPGRPADPGTPDQIIPGRPAKPGRPPSWIVPPVEEVPAKKGTFAVTLNEIKGESDDAVIDVTIGGVTKQLTFKDDFAGNLTVSAKDLGDKIVEEFGSSQTVGNQGFTLMSDQGTLKLVQDNEPTTASEIVSANALTASIKVTSYPVKEITEAANTSIGFGAKAVYTAEQPTKDTQKKEIPGKGVIDLSGYNFDKAIDYMRAHGFIGKTDTTYDDYFRIHYMKDQQQYHVELARSTDIDHTNTPRIIGDSVTAKVVDTATGAIVTSSDGIPRMGQTVTLDFGEELGEIVITCNGTYDFQENDFKGNTNCGYYISVNAPAKNGGTIDFSSLDKGKLAQAAKTANAAAGKGVTLQWNTDHLELISDGKVIGQTGTMTLGGNSAINPEFYTDPTDTATSLGTITITPGGSAILDADSFMNYTGDVASTKTPEIFASGLTYRGYDTKEQNLAPTVRGEEGVIHVPAQPGEGYDPGEPADPGTPDTVIPGRPPTPAIPPTPDIIIPGGHGLILQIGDTSEEYDRMEIIIDDMRTAAMGTRDKEGNQTASIADVDIGTQTGAEDAIAVIKDAINYVSSVRGDLGAYQNRLEHTANNLSVSVENIQDAESTIRDTDVADMMMLYTKNSILLQSAQAMLAQANQLPQGVMQLLG